MGSYPISMASKVELGCTVSALACFAGAADAWFGTGAVDLLVDLCLSDPEATVPAMETMPMNGSQVHSTHTSLFLATGLAFLGLGLVSSEIASFFRPRVRSKLEGRAKRRLIASMVYVARSCKDATPQDVSEAYLAVSGETLERGELAKAVAYLRSPNAPPIETILAKAKGEEKRRIVASASYIWSRHGMDSEPATRAIERITSAIGLEGDAVSSLLDPSWAAEATRVLKSVDTLARRTVSNATCEFQRVTTRIAGIS